MGWEWISSNRLISVQRCYAALRISIYRGCGRSPRHAPGAALLCSAEDFNDATAWATRVYVRWCSAAMQR